MSKGLEALDRIIDHLDLDYEYFYKQGNKDKEIIKKELKELEQYKTIDEQLGIEYPVLIKALTQPIAIKDDAGKITVMWAYPSLKINILDKRESWIMYGMEDDIEYLNVRDYGKTWALTKEELEI